MIYIGVMAGIGKNIGAGLATIGVKCVVKTQKFVMLGSAFAPPKAVYLNSPRFYNTSPKLDEKKNTLKRVDNPKMDDKKNAIKAALFLGGFVVLTPFILWGIIFLVKNPEFLDFFSIQNVFGTKPSIPPTIETVIETKNMAEVEIQPQIEKIEIDDRPEWEKFEERERDKANWKKLEDSDTRPQWERDEEEKTRDKKDKAPREPIIINLQKYESLPNKNVLSSDLSYDFSPFRGTPYENLLPSKIPSIMECRHQAGVYSKQVWDGIPPDRRPEVAESIKLYLALEDFSKTEFERYPLVQDFWAIDFHKKCIEQMAEEALSTGSSPDDGSSSATEKKVSNNNNNNE